MYKCIHVLPIIQIGNTFQELLFKMFAKLGIIIEAKETDIWFQKITNFTHISLGCDKAKNPFFICLSKSNNSSVEPERTTNKSSAEMS